MIFQISEDHKHSEKRKAIFAALLVIGIVAGAIWIFTTSENLYPKALSAIVALLLARHLPGAYKNIINHDLSCPTVTISMPQIKIEISHKGTVISIPLSDVESLRIQSIKGKIKSLLLNTKSFSDLRFEGYENLAAMAELLKKHTPTGKVKIATWYHR
ncbi:hypothetical protein [Phytopseudomonas punonensis]|uniref:hypothetical protein n=1 Tax=Phytopseudomonas punonensis TaxID=1220495 RepID=UPI00111497F5|nr:hypothetical protein [Pseudomonas punonensis]